MPTAPPRIYRVTPGRVNAFARCPLHYRAVYSARRPAPNAALQRGTLIHSLLAQYNRAVIAAGEAVDAAALLAREEPLLPDAQTADLAAQALAGYAAFLSTQNVQVRSTEEWITTRPRLLRDQPDLAVELSGRPDVITVRPDGTLVVIDVKTGATLPTPLELAAAPGSFVYEHLVADAHGDAEIEIVELIPHARAWVGIQLTAAHREASRALVRALVVALDRDTFPPQPSPFCALCPLAATCPGRRPRPTGADDAF